MHREDPASLPHVDKAALRHQGMPPIYFNGRVQAPDWRTRDLTCWRTARSQHVQRTSVHEVNIARFRTVIDGVPAFIGEPDIDLENGLANLSVNTKCDPACIVHAKPFAIRVHNVTCQSKEKEESRKKMLSRSTPMTLSFACREGFALLVAVFPDQSPTQLRVLVQQQQRRRQQDASGQGARPDSTYTICSAVEDLAALDIFRCCLVVSCTEPNCPLSVATAVTILLTGVMHACCTFCTSRHTETEVVNLHRDRLAAQYSPSMPLLPKQLPTVLQYLRHLAAAAAADVTFVVPGTSAKQDASAEALDTLQQSAGSGSGGDCSSVAELAEDSGICELCGDPTPERQLSACSRGHAVCSLCLRQYICYTHGLQVCCMHPDSVSQCECGATPTLHALHTHMLQCSWFSTPHRCISIANGSHASRRAWSRSSAWHLRRTALGRMMRWWRPSPSTAAPAATHTRTWRGRSSRQSCCSSAWRTHGVRPVWLLPASCPSGEHGRNSACMWPLH